MLSLFTLVEPFCKKKCLPCFEKAALRWYLQVDEICAQIDIKKKTKIITKTKTFDHYNFIKLFSIFWSIKKIFPEFQLRRNCFTRYTRKSPWIFLYTVLGFLFHAYAHACSLNFHSRNLNETLRIFDIFQPIFPASFKTCWNSHL